MTSQSELSGLNLELVPVERLILDGLQRSFLRVFKTPSVWVTSSDEVKAVARLFEGKPVTYPYATLRLGSQTESETRQAPNATSRRGLPAVITTNNKRYYRVHFLPMDFQVTSRLVTNSFQDLMKFSNSWMFARRNGNLKYEVAYGNVSFGIHLDLEQTITFPQREADPDNVQEYIMESNLTVQGFISDPILLEGMIIDTVIASTDLDLGNNPKVFWPVNVPRDNAFNSIASPNIPTNSR